LWEIPIVKATTVDDRRRIVMPPECPQHSAVTIQQLDENAWLVKRARPDRTVKMIAIPVIKKLPDDPEWEKTEAALARYAASRLPGPD
jgi:protoheme ferro-lyase